LNATESVEKLIETLANSITVDIEKGNELPESISAEVNALASLMTASAQLECGMLARNAAGTLINGR